jgi:hypothetical protein
MSHHYFGPEFGFRPTAGHLPTTPLTSFFPFYPTARCLEITWGTTRTCSPRSPMLACHTSPDLPNRWPNSNQNRNGGRY